MRAIHLINTNSLARLRKGTVTITLNKRSNINVIFSWRELCWIMQEIDFFFFFFFYNTAVFIENT